MSELKYAKYIITEERRLPSPPPENETMKMIAKQREAGNYIESTFMFGLDDSVLKGSFYATCVLLKDKKGTETVYSEVPHAHDFDEVWMFVGTVKDNPRELGGELDFWLEDEHYIIDKSCMVFLPRGLKHGPCGIKKIDSPIYFFTAANGAYGRSWEEKKV